MSKDKVVFAATKPLVVHNSLTDKKEEFIAEHDSGLIGMYVCGPTVYSEVHLGNLRTFVVFDLIYRYFLSHSKTNVRYVRNITDVGHLEDDGEDRISKKAKIEKVEPMEVATRYTNDFKEQLYKLNCKNPSIEPIASGHIIEQIDVIKEIIAKGYAYESNGSVYFDIEKFRTKHEYGELSNRLIDDLISNSRKLKSQDDKKNQHDFALWKKADNEHIMKWNSPWGEGFPGWHLECTAMSQKYLGKRFDIHGGGMDLKFPHHECEIAQSVSIYNEGPANYWIHTNMLTNNNKKMSKSTGNSILLKDLLLPSKYNKQKPYSNHAVRLFLLSAHYRSVLDISIKALDDCEILAKNIIDNCFSLGDFKNFNKKSQVNYEEIENIAIKCQNALNDDFNTPKFFAEFTSFNKLIKKVVNGELNIDKKNHSDLMSFYQHFTRIILGFGYENLPVKEYTEKVGIDLLSLLLMIRDNFRQKADYETSDFIRDELSKLGIDINDKD